MGSAVRAGDAVGRGNNDKKAGYLPAFFSTFSRRAGIAEITT